MGRDYSNKTSRGARGSSAGDRGEGESISAAQVLDRFTEVDDLIRETNHTLTRMDQTMNAIGEVLSGISGQELELPSRNSIVLVADAVVEPQEVEEVDLSIPKDGTLTNILLDYPEGANQSIGIGVKGVDGENLVPYGPSGVNFIALNDTNVDFELDYSVRKDETITVRFINNRDEGGDKAYATSIVTITEGL